MKTIFYVIYVIIRRPGSPYNVTPDGACHKARGPPPPPRGTQTRSRSRTQQRCPAPPQALPRVCPAPTPAPRIAAPRSQTWHPAGGIHRLNWQCSPREAGASKLLPRSSTSVPPCTSRAHGPLWGAACAPLRISGGRRMHLHRRLVLKLHAVRAVVLPIHRPSVQRVASLKQCGQSHATCQVAPASPGVAQLS